MLFINKHHSLSTNLKSGMASQKLQRMLADLDLSSSGGLDAAMAVASSRASSNPSICSQPRVQSPSTAYSSDGDGDDCTEDVDQYNTSEQVRLRLLLLSGFCQEYVFYISPKVSKLINDISLLCRVSARQKQAEPRGGPWRRGTLRAG